MNTARTTANTAKAGLAGLLITLLASSGALAADVVTELEQHPALGTFAAAVALTGMGPEMRAGGPYTIFAPTDEALAAEGWDKLLNGVYRTLRNRARLVELISYHVVADEAPLAAPAKRIELFALTGDTMTLESVSGRGLINDHIQIVATTEADNGVIHLVSGALWPARWSDEATEDVVQGLAAAR